MLQIEILKDVADEQEERIAALEKQNALLEARLAKLEEAIRGK